MKTLLTLLKNPYVLFYLATYFGFLAVCHFAGGMSVAEPLAVLLLLGLGFTTLAWAATRGVTPLDAPVRRPAAETSLLIAYLLVLTAFLTWGLEALNGAIPAPRMHEVALLVAKVVMFVALPAALMAAIHAYRLSEWLKTSWEKPHVRAALLMAAALLIFQAVFGRGLVDIRRSGAGAALVLAAFPAVFVWLLVEVGLVEEFFFRVLLQTRLAAWLKSEVGGVVLASLLFGLAHAPGLYFRTSRTLEGLGPNPAWYMAVGYSIVVTSVAGFFLGVLWARTKNLAVVMFVHAAGDLLPGIVPALQTWGLLSPK